MSHLYLVFLDSYEKNLLEEYYYFVKGFHQIITIENNSICVESDSDLKNCIKGADLKYLIEGNIPFELFETVKYEGGTNEDKTNYKTMFFRNSKRNV